MEPLKQLNTKDKAILKKNIHLLLAILVQN